jgi:hypothetical protein
LDTDDIETLRKRIKEKNLSWRAGTTALSQLPREARRNYLGLVIPEEEQRIVQEMMRQDEASVARLGRVFVYPSQWDWRAVSGQDWTTPIRDQSGCGACVAFATVAMIESNLEIFRRNPRMSPDLSEADLFFRGCGNCCASGWNFAPALRYAQVSGIPDEACYPYHSGQEHSCADREKRIVKIGGWKILYGSAQAKEWLSRKGPIMSGLSVYDDFFYYQGGVYGNASGGYVGDHAICIVGFDDAKGCWICKNSWGTFWGEDGWFRIGYGECGLGSRFAFYAVQLSADDDLIMPKEGRVVARLKGINTLLADEVWLSYPDSKLIFKAEEPNLGKSFYLGSFPSGSRLTLALKTSEGHTYYTDQSLNDDGCDHVQKVQTGTNRWELRWEDLYGLGEMDFNDVVMEIEIYGPSTDDLVVQKDGRVLVTFKSMQTRLQDELRLSSPRDMPIFNAESSSLGKTVDLGSFQAGTRLCFALKTSEGYTYYTDQMQNPDGQRHVRRLPTGSSKWELRWEDVFGLGDKDYKDLIFEVELVPASNQDVVLSRDCLVKARMIAMNTTLRNEFWLRRPEEKKIFDCIRENVGRTFEVGSFKAGTRLVFALVDQDGNIYTTDSKLNQDPRPHVLKLPLGVNKCQMRWEDQYGLKDRDYNDLVVEITMYPK